MNCMRKAAAILLLLLLAVGGGCVSERAAPPVEPLEAGPTPEQQMAYAQAESRLDSADPATRRQAAVALLSMHHPGAAEAALERLRRAQDPEVRVSMIEAVAFARDHRGFNALLDAVGDPAPFVRQAAASALARFTREAEIQSIMERADQAGPAERTLLYQALGEGLAVQAVPVLLRGLRAENDAVSLAAWQALQEIAKRELPPDPERWENWWQANRHKTREDVLEEHRRAMADRLDTVSAQLQQLREQQEELVRLVQSPDGETPRLLLNALGSRYELVRRYAAFRLADLTKQEIGGLSLDDKSVYTTLARGLDDDSAAVRQNVLRFALKLEGSYRPDIVKKVLRDDDPEVLQLAVAAVQGEMGAEVIDRLEELLLESPHEQVREAAANMLGKLGAQDSVPALVNALDDPFENVRWFAIEALRKLNATQAVPRIWQVLEEDESARVREIAASALGELGQPSAGPSLRRALGDSNERVRRKAADALLMLARDNYEIMASIATAFREADMPEKARQVLRSIIETFGDDEQMQTRVIEAYVALAGLQVEQGDHAASAGTYQELLDYAGAEADTGLVRQWQQRIVDNWLDAGEPVRVASAAEAWLADAPENAGPSLYELVLNAAERMFLEGYTEQGSTVLNLLKERIGENVEPEVQRRIERLERREQE